MGSVSVVGVLLIVGALAAAGLTGFAAPAIAADAASSPAPVTGRVAAGQHVRIVRIARGSGSPQVTVAGATGPDAAGQAVREAQSAPGTLAVSVDLRRQAQEAAPSDDTYRSLQWALTKLGAETAWPRTSGAGVTVAVIDTGVAAVPDLSGQLLPGVDYVTGSGNGTADAAGHGTHVAGIIAARANNGLGIAGLAPSVKILPVRVLDADGSGYDSDIANGIVYAADHGASVINLSLGGPGYSSVLAQAVSYALSKNVVVVAAAGNAKQSGNAASYPAALPGVLAVAATDSSDAVAPFSNTGSYVKVAAPGVHVLSTVPGGYAYGDGTSMASPYVAAAAALVRSANGGLSESAVVTDLTTTATDLGPAGRDDASGSGLVNPLKAVCAVSICPGESRFELQRFTNRLTYGSSVTVRARLLNAGSNIGLAGQRVRWCYALPGQGAHCVAVTTDAAGWTQYTLAPKQSGNVSAEFGGTSSASAVTTTTAEVFVVPALTVRTAKRTVAVSVAPAARQPLQLQRWTGKLWQTVRNTTTDVAGHITWAGLASGATVRVLALPYGGRMLTTSTSYRIP